MSIDGYIQEDIQSREFRSIATLIEARANSFGDGSLAAAELELVANYLRCLAAGMVNLEYGKYRVVDPCQGTCTEFKGFSDSDHGQDCHRVVKPWLNKGTPCS